MKFFIIAAVLALASPALAQQSQQSVSQLAVDLMTNIAAMAKAVDQQAAVIQAQNAKIKELQDQLDAQKK